MLVLLSPAKRLDFDSPAGCVEVSTPPMLDQSEVLIDTLRKMTTPKLRKLMGLSESLASLNLERYQNFNTPFTAENAKAAAWAFQGDVYKGLDAATFAEKDQRFAQGNVRILSGLYGLLRPMDLIQPYRLEMGTRLKTQRGTDLYKFWGDRITDAINTDLAASGHQHVLNLASNEYFKSVRKKQLNAPVTNVAFKDFKNGQYKIISFFAKFARGVMARWVVTQQITAPHDLKAFTEEGYAYSEELSSQDTLTFTRG